MRVLRREAEHEQLLSPCVRDVHAPLVARPEFVSGLTKKLARRYQGLVSRFGRTVEFGTRVVWRVPAIDDVEEIARQKVPSRLSRERTYL